MKDKNNKLGLNDKEINKKNEEYYRFKKSCWPCIYFNYLLSGVFIISLIIIPMLLLIIIIISVSFLSLIIKVSQVSFVSELEILDWRYEHSVQFIAFLNNILSLDTGKMQSFSSIITFMFSGKDAKEDDNEKVSRKRFMNGLISYSVNIQGLLKTLMILPQIGTPELQRIFIHDIRDKIVINKNDEENNSSILEE